MRKFLWCLVAILGITNVGCVLDEVFRDRRDGRAAQINRSLDEISP